METAVVWAVAFALIGAAGIAAIAVLTGHSSVAVNLRTGVIFAGICGVLGAALAVASLRAARQAWVSAPR